MKKSFKTILFSLGLLFSLTMFKITNVNADSGINNSIFEVGIVGGDPVKTGKFPWMVAILRTDVQGSAFNRHFCGGTLIAPQWILTAAHCVKSFGMEVLLGEIDLEGSGGQTHSVDRSVIHPNYIKKKHPFDIALLHLATPSSIKPVLLEKSFNFQNKTGKDARALGWGVTRQIANDKYYLTNLQQVNITIKDTSICHYPTNSPPKINNIICLGITDKKDTCGGDSGGPLLMFDQINKKWKQIGITSYGSAACAQPNGYTVYTQVDKYNQFILSNINSTSNTAEEILARCVSKYPDYLGKKDGTTFPCGNSEVCQNTTGGTLMNITQISVLSNNKNEILEYLDTNVGWKKISYAALNYCN
ncbi:MAG: trypsin-like serine protease [Methylococcales bacterium]|nr:trypsin-like serine protease [Methylococcales bacterium]